MEYFTISSSHDTMVQISIKSESKPLIPDLSTIFLSIAVFRKVGIILFGHYPLFPFRIQGKLKHIVQT